MNEYGAYDECPDCNGFGATGQYGQSICIKCVDRMRDELTKADAENARLREALDLALEDPDLECRKCGWRGDYSECEDMYHCPKCDGRTREFDLYARLRAALGGI